MNTAYEHPEPRWALAPIILATLVIGAVWFRFVGRWAEVDTTVLTRAARATLAEGTIEPSQGVYLNGFTYPALLGFLSRTTGLSITTVQTMLVPWCYISIGLIIFIVFRATIGNGKLAAIASCLLLVQPDFLFVNQRGSHEKVTWALVLTLFFALLSSFRQRRFSYSAPMTIVFYICGFALISTNAFFASSLITGFILSFVGGMLLIRWLLRERESRAFFRRLGYAFVTLSVFSYLYIVYVFPPVRANLANLEGVFDRVGTLYGSVEKTLEPAESGTNESGGEGQPDTSDVVGEAAASPYRTVSTAWTNPGVFFALTSLTWILIFLATIAWLISLYLFVRKGVPRERVPIFVVWLLAGATGFQILSSIIADASGALGANMQLRLFPSFTLFVIPLVVATLRVPRGIWTKSHVPAIFTIGAAVAFGFFTIAAYFKATNDPIFSNKWVFYTTQEQEMIAWADTNLKDYGIWSEFDERLLAASIMLSDDAGSELDGAFWVRGGGEGQTVFPSSSTRFIAISDVTELRAIRYRGDVPDVRGTDKLYDNGAVQIYHRLPESPYAP